MFLALRSPLVKRFLPWGGATGAKQVAKAAPVSGAPAGGSVRETGETDTAQPAGPSEERQQSQAAAGASAAASSAATSRNAAEPARPQAVPLQGNAARASRPAGHDAVAAPAAVASDEGKAAAPALAGVAVAAFGEQLLVGTITSVVQAELERAGLQPLDAATLPTADRLLRGQAEPATDELVRAARESGVAVLVLARVVPAGQRELQYMGRYDVAYSSRVTLTCYDVAAGRPKGRSLNATIEYTTLTIEAATERALGPLVQEIARQLR